MAVWKYRFLNQNFQEWNCRVCVFRKLPRWFVLKPELLQDSQHPQDFTGKGICSKRGGESCLSPWPYSLGVDMYLLCAWRRTGYEAWIECCFDLASYNVAHKQGSSALFPLLIIRRLGQVVSLLFFLCSAVSGLILEEALRLCSCWVPLR